MAGPLARALAWLSALTCVAAADRFALPPGFEGLWEGVPYASIAGPWSQPFRFSIARTEEGDYLFEDNLRLDTTEVRYRSWQRTYILGSGLASGTMLHCPGPRNHSLQRQAMMRAHHVDNSSVTFCLWKWPGYVESEHPFPFKTMDCYSDGNGCKCFNWTMRVDTTGSMLDYRATMAGSPGLERSRHLYVHLSRIGGAPPVNLSFPGEGGRKFTCDYGGRDGHVVSRVGCPFVGAPAIRPPFGEAGIVQHSGFDHCYVLNKVVGVVLQWSLDFGRSALRVQISAPAPFGDKTYVAIGFRPLGGASSERARVLGTGREQRFGMRGADIVLGGVRGIRRMYANHFTGPPDEDDSLPIAEESVTFANGWITLRFTRPLVGGRLHAVFGMNASIASDLSDMLWAVGRWGPEVGGFQGHGVRRGWREVNWTDPEFDARPLLSLRPYKCAPPPLLL